ncbi:minor capsid protein [Enterococcus sp. BWB1-3]|uniref:minor capsid protein n=1 Tax=Enterococcus sp. BWB1-3 TaxID=2787713 RepID=UPI001924B07A|nr:minor capsid protein [Enterococcus sp. BWB1-3]MBL1228144.1 minor capsid protein [Enterococcus sp. BWB1-3]
MAQKKLSYWKKRALKQEQASQVRTDNIEQVITNAYLKAQDYLTSQVKKIFNRVKNKNSFETSEFKRILNESVSPSSLVELQTIAKKIVDPELQQSAKRTLNALAAKGRITRLDDLKGKMHITVNRVANVQLNKTTDFFISEIHEAYNDTLAEEFVHELSNKGIIFEIWNKNRTYEFKELPIQKTRTILESRWLGSNYSERIWGDTEALAKRLEELFTVEALSGMSEFEMAKAIAKEFDRSINVARRLIRTEANYMANQAKLKAWESRGVKHYKLVVVLDLRTSKICQKKSREDKVYKVSEAVVNGEKGNYPPFHPWCRTVVIAYHGERTTKGIRTANDPISNETFTIKQSATYDGWMNILKKRYSQEEIEKQKKKLKAA